MVGGILLIQKVTAVRNKQWAPGMNWLTSERLLEWLDQVHIFEMFFGGSLHPEVIKKSFYLLEFLYKHDRLKEP